MRKIASVAAGSAALLLGAAGAYAQVTTTDIQQQGPYRHVGSGIMFPERVGQFQRTRIVKFEDPSGEDIGVSYSMDTPQGRIALTQYVYPAPAASAAAAKEKSCREEFDGSARAIEKNGAATKLGEKAAAPQPGVQPPLALRSDYSLNRTMDGKQQELRSQLHLYCYVRGNWFVKYRVSTPKTVALDAAMASFLSSGPWPGR